MDPSLAGVITAQFKRWVGDVDDEIVEMILTYDSKDDLFEWLVDYFGESVEPASVSGFVDELFRRDGEAKTDFVPPPRPAPPRSEEPAFAEAASSSAGPVEDQKPFVDTSNDEELARKLQMMEQYGGYDEKPHKPAYKPPNKQPKAVKKLKKAGVISGRVSCLCQASRHPLVNNCAQCGRIVCSEEGEGPCPFCGNMVYAKNTVQVDDPDLLKAMARTATLISYDRDAAKRTKVLDDQSDWYRESDNLWLSKEQRAEAVRKAQEIEEKQSEINRKTVLNIDFAGRTATVVDNRKLIEEAKEQDKEHFDEWREDADAQRINPGASALRDRNEKLYSFLRASLHATGRQIAKKDKAQDEDEENRPRRRFRNLGAHGPSEFENVGQAFSTAAAGLGEGEEMTDMPWAPDSEDTGACLTLHQPWASLIVYGFKKAEGRSWSSNFTGRLYIHAASKEPEPEVVKALEAKYTEWYEAAGIPIPKFPSSYPTSALLGCCDVEKVVPQEEYMDHLKSHPEMVQEENGSAYIFLCNHARRLTLPVKMSGEHKIWYLPKKQLPNYQHSLTVHPWPKPARELNHFPIGEVWDLTEDNNDEGVDCTAFN
mmetsp:Transcript_9144/g.21939  ORF Transcript_9144/g.21939 Transcript_9144/m.21939 type:complete len:597 (+) Transcript_9144:68-1858(+)